MRKITAISLACAAILGAAETQSQTTLDTVSVVETKLEGISGEAIKSADLADALNKEVPSVSMVRRSGIANDIIIRGQKKDNINILIDDAKVHGACPNRMDPPTSHVLTNNIESIEIIEGPYDVETFGSMSAVAKIHTKEPTEKLSGEVNVNIGGWGYKKTSATVSGGSEHVRGLISISRETGKQYEDGDGTTLAQQLINATDGTAQAATQYKDPTMRAFTKKTLMAKLHVDITDTQTLRLGYTANRSDNILYPSSKMDALYDDSDIFTLEYSALDLGRYSKALDLRYYYSGVDHPMSTQYRKSSMMMGNIVSKLSTEANGITLKNTTALSDSAELIVGVDASSRNWDGSYYKNDMPMMSPAGATRTSITGVDTKNMALFATMEKTYSDLTLKAGLRYDDTQITNTSLQPENDYTALSANLFATYQASKSMKLFGGVGKASRVPDARELYFYSSKGEEIGTPTLNQTTNYEADFGMENSYDKLSVKTKLFYSMLSDFIHFNASKTLNKFENVDATIYGLSFNGSYQATDAFSIDFGAAYQRGKKDNALVGQTDTDLAEIPPLKGNLALNYAYTSLSSARIELVAADTWRDFDGDNGEQELGAWNVVNMKIDHNFDNGMGLTLGVDNIFDATYAVSNTYYDLTLIPDGTGEVMLLNEPGRYAYVNVRYAF